MIKAPAKRYAPEDPYRLCSAVESFLSTCRRPAVLDFGDHPIELHPEAYALHVRSGYLVIDAWSHERSLSRRILSTEQPSNGVLDCIVQHFGNRIGALTFLDLARPQTAIRTARGSRQNFAEQFRRMLSRQFPGWDLASLSSAMDLRRSFSISFPRAHLRRGNSHLAAVACPQEEDESAMLSAALLWFDQCSAKLAPSTSISLCLFLPQNAGALTAHRLNWLTGRQLGTRIFRFNEHGMAGEVDAQDLGNIETSVRSRSIPVELSPDLSAFLDRLARMDAVGCCPEMDGSVSIRFRGTEFARLHREKLLLGIDDKRTLRPDDYIEVERYASHLAGIAPDSRHSEFPSFPERWFESAVRSHLTACDPNLLEAPVHGQVLSMAGDRNELVDLLAVSSSGRLAVIELKVAEDIHLPLQALDYWIRIRWHAQRGELGHLFTGVSLIGEAPTLLLVAPALSFHPTNQIVLRYFSPAISVERVGVNSDWESSLKVLFRLQGSDLPISHRGVSR